MKSELALARLKELLHYDPETGIFVWRVAINSRVPAGKVAGGAQGKGYIQIRIDKRIYLAHRLAWLYITGEWPRKYIDHINCVKNDNRFANLREATQSQNVCNSKLGSDNTSGLKGASWSRRHKRWYAFITVAGKSKYLGHFPSPEEAHAAYCEAAKKTYGAFFRAA